MIMQADTFLEIIRKTDISLITGVPDSLLKNFTQALDRDEGVFTHIIAANEGNAVAIGIGHQLATSRRPLIYMQNSGLGNAVNPLVSLAHENVYSIPMVLLIGWRGEPGSKDEPQHMVQGSITVSILEELGIPHLVMNKKTSVLEVEDFLTLKNMHVDSPIAILVCSGTFEGDLVQVENISQCELSREMAINSIIDAIPSDSVVVATTGKLGRELDERRARDKMSGVDFLTVGGMGHASSIALGLAMSLPERNVICLDGDGAALMHMGSLAIIGNLKPRNFVHVLINNGIHESVGGSSIGNQNINYELISSGCGYSDYRCLRSAMEIEKAFSFVDKPSGPHFVEIITNTSSRADLGRPSSTPQVNKLAFRDHLRVKS
jgi:phosphonopyruvate decarboxylase